MTASSASSREMEAGGELALPAGKPPQGSGLMQVKCIDASHIEYIIVLQRDLTLCSCLRGVQSNAQHIVRVAKSKACKRIGS